MVGLPGRAIRVAPAGTFTAAEAPTATMRPLLTTSVARSRGALPVPSVTRAPVSATVPGAGACANGRLDDNVARTTSMANDTAAGRVGIRIMSNLLGKAMGLQRGSGEIR